MSMNTQYDKENLLSGTVNPKIYSALVIHLYQLLYISQLASLFCATIILMGLFNLPGDNTLLLAWYVFFIIIFAMRIIMMKIFMKQKDPDFRLWKNLYVIGALLSGLCWGFVGSFLFLGATNAEQILIILVIAGVTAGAAPMLSADLISSGLFITASLFPTIFSLCFFKNTQSNYPLFGAAVICYYFYLLVLCFRLHDIIKNSIGLKFENDNLLDNISQTKNQLEIINKKLAHAATHDPLTNLANRILFEHNLIKAIARARKNNTILALLYIDLDNFKEINDAHGHHTGDRLLLQLIERIRKNTRQSDTVARLGGDEITILLEKINHPEIIYLTADRLCEILAAPVIIHNHIIKVTASIGISVFPEDGEDVETLLKNADKAMYYVKEHGRNNFHFSASASEK